MNEKKWSRKRAVSDILAWRLARAGAATVWTETNRAAVKKNLEGLHDEDLLATWRREKPAE